VQKLTKQKVNDQEYFIEELVIAKERLLANMRQLQAIITSPNTSDIAKLRVAKVDFQLNITLLKLEYESSLPAKSIKDKVTTNKLFLMAGQTTKGSNLELGLERKSLCTIP